MPVEVEGVEGMQSLVGQEVGPSKWRTVTQEDIDAFAELSGDHQWIHVDVERASTESPFGTTIAHATSPSRWSTASAANCRRPARPRRQRRLEQDPLPGPGPLRLPRPRQGRGRLDDRDRRRLVGYITRFSLEVEGNEKPCFVGDSVVRVSRRPDGDVTAPPGRVARRR